MTAAVSSAVAGPAGDPGAVAAAARRWAGLAEALAPAARLAERSPASDGWSGAAAGACVSALAVQGDRIRALADAAGTAAEALSRYAAELAGYQEEWARARSRSGDPSVLVETADRLRAAGAAAAGRAAAAVDRAAALVPPRPAGTVAGLQQLREWQSELGLGVDESLGSMLLTTFRFRPGRLRADPLGYAEDVRRQVGGLAEAARHPRALAGALLDVDTWRTSPVRAVGHLVPDAVASVATGGTVAAGRRAASTAARTARTAELDAASAAARRELVRTATGRAEPVPGGWSGDGLALDPVTAGRVSAYHRLVARHEAALTARLHRLADRLGATLQGLEHRVKELDSLNRKVAELVARRGSGPQTLHRVLEQQGDTLRYTLVLPHRGYAAAVRRAALELDRAGYARAGVHNWWDNPRYHGLNTSWTDPATGVRFEVQFHTPGTWLATVRTHPWYEDWRLPETPAAVKAELEARIGAEYAAAGVPRRVGGLTGETLPPPEPVALPVLPAAGAAVGTASAVTAARSTRRPPAR